MPKSRTTQCKDEDLNLAYKERENEELIKKGSAILDKACLNPEQYYAKMKTSIWPIKRERERENEELIRKKE